MELHWLLIAGPALHSRFESSPCVFCNPPTPPLHHGERVKDKNQSDTTGCLTSKRLPSKLFPRRALILPALVFSITFLQPPLLINSIRAVIFVHFLYTSPRLLLLTKLSLKSLHISRRRNRDIAGFLPFPDSTVSLPILIHPSRASFPFCYDTAAEYRETEPEDPTCQQTKTQSSPELPLV